MNQSSQVCRKKRIRKESNHLSTIYTIDSIPLLDAKYVDLNEPNIDYLFNDNCGLLRIECGHELQIFVERNWYLFVVRFETFERLKIKCICVELSFQRKILDLNLLFNFKKSVKANNNNKELS